MKIVFEPKANKKFDTYEIQLPDTWDEIRCNALLMTMKYGITSSGKRRSHDLFGEKFQPTPDATARLVL